MYVLTSLSNSFNSKKYMLFSFIFPRQKYAKNHQTGRDALLRNQFPGLSASRDGTSLRACGEIAEADCRGGVGQGEASADFQVKFTFFKGRG